MKNSQLTTFLKISPTKNDPKILTPICNVQTSTTLTRTHGKRSKGDSDARHRQKFANPERSRSYEVRADDWGHSAEGGIDRRRRGRLHFRRRSGNADSLRQIHALHRQEVSHMRPRSLSREIESGPYHQRQSIRGHDHQLRETPAQAQDTRQNFRPQHYADSSRAHSAGNVAGGIWRECWAH